MKNATTATVISIGLILAGCTGSNDASPVKPDDSTNGVDAASSTGTSTSAMPAPTKDNFYFVDTSYEGIRSVVREEETDTVSSYVEIPETDWSKINKIITAEVNELRNDFRAVTRDLTPKFDGKFSERVSYNVIYRGDGVLTLALNTLFDTQGASSERHHRVLTFDTDNDRQVTVADLYDGAINADGSINTSDPAIKELVARARAELQEHYNDSEVFFQDLTAATLDGFSLAEDGTTLEIHFDAGTVGAYSAGNLEIAIDTHQLEHQPNSALAARVFSHTKQDKPADPPSGTAQDDTTPGQTKSADHSPAKSHNDYQSPATQPSQAANQQLAQQAPRKPEAPRVALTFDDGPAANTNRLLDILAQYNAKATFFTVGSSVDVNPGTVARTLNEGHALGNHTYNHPDLTTLGADGVRNELKQGNQAIANATGGHTPTMLRPPYGATNQTVNNVAAEFGMANIMWSVDTRDWQDRDASLVCNRAVTNAYDGAVILMHDLHGTTVDAMPCILDSLSSQGYQFVAADQLFGGVEPGLNYYGG